MSGIEDEFEPVEQPVEETPEPEAPEPEVEAQAEPEKEPEAIMVPLAALEKERQKRQDAEMLLQKQPAPKPEPLPDVIEDQQAFAAAVTSKAEQLAINTQLNMSEIMAREAHGDAVVDEALEAAKAAGVASQFASKRHAYGEMVKWHKSQVAVAEIGDPASYKEKVRAEVLAELQASRVAEAVKAPPTMANETSVGGRVAPPSDLTDLDDLLP